MDKYEITTGYEGPKPKIVHGLVEVYKEFPWVYVDEERTQFYLVTEVSEVPWDILRNNENPLSYWSALDDKENTTYDLRNKNMGYINPEYIRWIEDDFLFDADMREYPFCEITMKDGRKYWLADYWENIDLNGLGLKETNTTNETT